MGDSPGDLLRPKRDNATGSLGEPAAMPDAGAFPFVPPSPRSIARTIEGAADAAEVKNARSLVFDSLVKGEDDIVGFVAYGLYKQSKRDWFAAFEKEHRRAPNPGEVRSFIVGESTERRLTTYRHLAETTLAQQSAAPRARLPVPVAAATTPASSSFVLGRGSDQRGRAPSRGSLPALLSYLALIVLVVIGMAWLLRSGILGLGRW